MSDTRDELLRQRLRIIDEMIEHCRQTNSKDGERFWKERRQMVEQEHKRPPN